jgi:hypothetical protein
MFKKIVTMALFTSTLLLAESGVGININEKDLEIEGVLDSRNLEALQTSSTIFQIDANFLNVNETEKLIGAGVVATNKLEAVEGVELAFGAKGIWAEVGHDNFKALPFVAKVKYTLPPLMYKIPPVSLEGIGLYAPKVLSFGDSEEYTEFRLVANAEVIESVNIYAGYRNIHRTYKGVGQSLFNTGFYGGLKYVY